MSIRVLIADDHPVVIGGLKLVLEASDDDIEVVAQARNGREAVALAAQKKPHICILDVSMPEFDGLEALQALQKSHSHTKVIFLSLHSSDTLLQKALEYGARGYVLKESAAAEIVTAVREVHAGKVFLSPALAGSMVQHVLGHGHGPRAGAPLTSRETEILKHVGAGLVAKEIAARLKVSHNTVRVHLNSIRRKLDLHTNGELLRHALREGLATL